MSFNNTKYITKKISKLKVVMIINNLAFIFRFNGEYYYLRVINNDEGLYIETKEDAYKVLNKQFKCEVVIASFKEIEERSKGSDVFIAMKRIIREDKLKNLERDG